MTADEADLRPELTWRDMQHIAVLTSVPFSPDDPDWTTTSAGRKYSYKCEDLHGFWSQAG